jgi:hypothetical protein
MSDTTEIAEQVAGWTGLGVKLPEELADAITVFEALKYTEVGHAPVAIDTVTPKTRFGSWPTSSSCRRFREGVCRYCRRRGSKL